MTAKELHNECADRDPRPLEWKDGESEREGFEKWWNGLPLSYRITFQTNLHHWAGWKARQPEIDALKFDKEFHEIVVKARDHLLAVNKALTAENEALGKDAERLRNAAKPVIDYFFEEYETRTPESDVAAFLELSNAYYKRQNRFSRTAPDTKGE